jgi:carbonic anhydrase/acetyltransferase-like protein (isoleucine patch superfamily)
MLLSHLRRSPRVAPSAYVAPTATVCGDVAIGANCRIMHGASIIAEGGRIEIGDYCIIMGQEVEMGAVLARVRLG